MTEALSTVAAGLIAAIGAWAIIGIGVALVTLVHISRLHRRPWDE